MVIGEPDVEVPRVRALGVFEALADEALHKTRDVMAEDVGGKSNAWLQSGMNAATQDSIAALAPILAHVDALAAASVRSRSHRERARHPTRGDLDSPKRS